MIHGAPEGAESRRPPPPRLLALIETDLRLKPGDGKAGMGFVR